MEEMQEELNRLKKELEEFQQKYLFAGNYKLIAAILDKLDVDNLVLSYKEIEKQPMPLYIVEFHKNKRQAIIKRYKHE